MDRRGDMVLPSAASKLTLVMEADMSASGLDNENKDMADAHVATIYEVTHSLSLTRSYIPQPQ